jgi:uncharacterized protein
MTLSPSLKSSARIETIDILRGFTLFGIIIIHMTEQYYAGMLPEGITTTPTLADKITGGVTALLIMGKFYMIFSFLFGLSFYIQFSKTDSSFLVRFAWRLAILGIIGLLHHLHYRGDILTIYAFLGFFLLIFNRLSDQALFVTGLLLTLNLPTIIFRAYAVAVNYDLNSLFNSDPAALKQYYETVKHGTYLEIIRANFLDFNSKVIFQIWSGRLFITLGLFLLGIYAGRKKFFENLSTYTTHLEKAIKYALLAMLGFIIIAAAFFVGAAVLKIPLSNSVNMLVGGTLFDFFNTALAIIYVAAIILLVKNKKWEKILSPLYPVGRMGLTTYLMQSLFGTLIFFSYGLGLLADIGAGLCVILAIGLFGIQILFAKFWFRYFQYGPVEWLWRSLTLLKVQPLTKPSGRAITA